MASELVDDIGAGLRRAFAAAGDDVEVTMGERASAGATRATLFAELMRSGSGAIVPVVVQVDLFDDTDLAEKRSTMAAESACLRLAKAAGVRVPAVLLASDDGTYLGGSFTVCTRIDGLTIPRHILRAVAADPGLGPRLTYQCGESLARLHAIEVGDVPESVRRLDEPTPSAAYVAERAEAHLELLQPSPAMALGLRWLQRETPSQPAMPSLVHGDFRNGNIIVDPNDGLAAILDWEIAHVGDPMEDLAWLCTRFWRFGNDHLPVGGFGRVADLRAGYESAGGVWRDDAFQWWLAARALWWAQGLAGQARSYVTGLTDALVLAASGRRVAEMEYDLLMLTA